jgi:hypothetical protein
MARCKHPKLSKPEVELALWLRSVPPARKAGGPGTVNVPVIESQLLGLWRVSGGARQRHRQFVEATGQGRGRMSVSHRHGPMRAILSPSPGRAARRRAGAGKGEADVQVDFDSRLADDDVVYQYSIQ